MGLEYAHKGYEYQDLLCALFITEQLLTSDNATFKVDKKESKNDKFDDITIISSNGILKRQIKYSEDKILQKADLSSASYDLALDILFKSWQETISAGTIDLRICLAWEYIEGNGELDFLKEVNCYNLYNDENVKFLKIDIDSIWENGRLPKSSWRRLRSQAQNINREDFGAFLNDLIIEINLPKSSNNIANPAALESLVISKLKKLGVGKYPNHSKSVEDVLLNLTHIVKSSRARGEELSFTTILYRLGLKNDFGNIQQDFVIDKDLNVINEFRYQHFYDFIFTNQKTVLIGQPGSGKSWFLQNFIEYLKNHSVKIVQHYCYTGIDDLYEKERITINVFLANLINDIIIVYPNLAECKSTKYGVDLDELQTLINNIKEEIVFIIDGLDHIGRIYNFHKSIIKEVDTEIIKVLSKLKFPENIRVVLASQPIAEVIQLTDDSYEVFNVLPWDINDTEKLLTNNGFGDINLDRNVKLSNLLMKKSNGNPLYLTYLINELKGYSPT
ncbi:NACHT domain-containing protein, partial [Herbivorax sp. ANBcel31]|uniref:NACHT domain-containing protein n=1 Tax=Herbivorax sp. ANBcel31 TaxID=3069754 RepID=UPI0027B70A8C